MDSLCHNVRIQAQGGEAIPFLTKAQARVHIRYNLRSARKGNALLQNHSYNRLTVKEVASLFREYQIKLSISDLNTTTIIQAIKSLNRYDFDRLIHQALDTLKTQADRYCLVLDLDDSGALKFL